MSGSATYECCAQDDVDAVNTHTGRFAGKLAWLFLMLALANIAMDWWHGIPLALGWFSLACLAAWILLLAWDLVARDRIIRRQYRQSLKMRSPIKLSWDEEAIRFDTGLSRAIYRWDGFFSWAGSATSLLLYRDSAMFFPVPRRALPPGAYEEMVKSLRAAQVPEKGRSILQSDQSSPMSS